VFFQRKGPGGLGRSVAETGLLDETVVKLALAAMRRFAFCVNQMGVKQLEIIATAASS